MSPSGQRLVIEPATAADATALRELHILTWADTNGPLVPPEFQARRLSQHRVRNWDALIAAQNAEGGGVLVAREGPDLVGFCQYGPSEDEDDRGDAVGHIHRLYIHPRAQGRGVGRALLEQSVHRLSEARMRSLTLWALESDTRARGFYERRGWRADGARRFDGVWDVRYRREPEDPGIS